MKIINIKGIIILVVILVIFQYAVGLLISPALGKIVLDKLNDYKGSQIYADSVNVWPLTLSVNLKNLRIFDPDNTKERIMKVGGASARLSLLALLSKRVVVSYLRVNDADITVTREDDGSFNLEKMGRSEEEAEHAQRPLAFFDRFKGKEDWFGRLFDILQKNTSKEAIEEEKKEKIEEKLVREDVEYLPKGRRVKFVTSKDEYLVLINRLDVVNASVDVDAGKEDGLRVDRTMIRVRDIGVHPKEGVRFDSAKVKGRLSKDDNEAGDFELFYDEDLEEDDLITKIRFEANDVDLAVTNFFYKDSVPVEVKKGKLTLRSDTELVNDNINSENNLELRGQELAPKSGSRVTLGVVPVATVCEIMNTIDPLKLKFTITGTTEHPKFGGFRDSLLALLKPSLKSLGREFKKEGVGMFDKFLGRGTETEEGEESTKSGGIKESLSSFKSLFSSGGTAEE